MQDKLKNMDKQIKSDNNSCKSVSVKSDDTEGQMEFALSKLLGREDAGTNKQGT